MRPALLALALLLAPATALSQVQINIDRGGHVSIGVNVATYPTLQRIPNYPVYYAPSVRGTNYFFYDGLYWVYEGGEWQTSSWYNGPWQRVDRYEVPAPLLRVPVRYYRAAPATFQGYRAEAAPRWNEQWGTAWTARREGWERVETRSLPAPAPLPVYQRDFSGVRYPTTIDHQAVVMTERYRYQPREAVAQKVFEERRSVAKKRKDEGWQPPGQRRDERGMPEHAKGKAKGHDRDERGMPEHAKGKAKGHDRREDNDRDDKRDKDKDKQKDKKEKKDKKDKD